MSTQYKFDEEFKEDEARIRSEIFDLQNKVEDMQDSIFRKKAELICLATSRKISRMNVVLEDLEKRRKELEQHQEEDSSNKERLEKLNKAFKKRSAKFMELSKKFDVYNQRAIYPSATPLKAEKRARCLAEDEEEEHDLERFMKKFRYSSDSESDSSDEEFSVPKEPASTPLFLEVDDEEDE